MSNKTIGQLENYIIGEAGAETIVYANGITKKVSVSSMADMLWDQMYINAKKVICVCSYCGAGNVITNSVCCQCGAPIGNEAKA